jgi:hypothetical protein
VAFGQLPGGLPTLGFSCTDTSEELDACLPKPFFETVLEDGTMPDQRADASFLES